MYKLLLPLSLLSLTACNFPISLDECSVDSDCAPYGDKTQYCTSDHLCTVGKPAESLCTEIYPPNSPANALVVGMLVDSADSDDRLPLEAVKLGIDQVNQRRSGEPPLALHVCETGASEDNARKSMQVLARRRNAVAVVGPPSSSAVFAIKDEVIRSGIPIVSYSATSPEISSLGTSSGPVDGLFYRVAPSDSLQGPVLAHQLEKNPLTSGYALLFVDDPYGRGLKDEFIAAVSQQPALTVTYLEPAGTPDEMGMQQAVQSIIDHSPPLSYVVAITNVYSQYIVSDLQDFPLPSSGGLHNIYMADGAKSKTVLDLVEPPLTQPSKRNPHLSRISGTAPTTDTANDGGTRAYAKYDNDFRLRWKDEDPTSSTYAAYAYDAFYAVAIAIGAAGTEVTADKVSRLLGHINNYNAVTHKCVRDQGSANQIEVGMTSYTPAKDKLSAASGLVLLGASGPICFTPHGDRASGVYESWEIAVGNKQFRTETIH